MKVTAYDPLVGEDRFRDLGVERTPTLEALLAGADVVTLHSPLNDETRGLIDREAIATMRDGARLVNAARGALVDEDALADAIRSGKLAGAALDVFSSEPYDGPLLELDEVVVTPHLAASTDEAQDRAGSSQPSRSWPRSREASSRRPSTSPSSIRPTSKSSGRSSPWRDDWGASRVELADGRPERIAVAAHGPLSDYDTRLLTVAALNGAFEGRSDQVVNVVNAPLIAAERGIAVSEERFRASRDYTNVVEVRIGTDGEEAAVSGTTIGPEGRLFLAGAPDGIDIELAQHMIFLVYNDLPGVIGRVGTLCGEAGVNIANMAVSRTKEGGKALMVFSVDTAAPPELVERLHEVGFDDARFIEL